MLDTQMAGLAIFDEVGTCLGLNAIGMQLCQSADAPLDKAAPGSAISFAADTLNRLALLEQPAWYRVLKRRDPQHFTHSLPNSG